MLPLDTHQLCGDLEPRRHPWSVGIDVLTAVHEVSTVRMAGDAASNRLTPKVGIANEEKRPMAKTPSDAAESQSRIAVAPSSATDRRGPATTSVPQTTYWDVFCDLWASPDDLAPTPLDFGPLDFEPLDFGPLDFGYGARLRDMQRIGGDFDKAIAELGLREK